MKKSRDLKLFFSRPAELTRSIDTPEKAWDFLAIKLYPNGEMHCPHCGSKGYKLKKKHHFICSNRKCEKKYNILFGTIWQSTKVPLNKWLEGIYLHLTRKKGVSSLQLSKDLGISQSAAYLMIGKIQHMLKEDNIVLRNVVQIDELMHGPIAGYMHKDKKPPGNLTGRSNLIKTPVLAIKQPGKGGKLVVAVIKEASKACIREVVFKHVEFGSTILTDEFTAYRTLSKYYTHYWCNHHKKKYVVGGASTNAVENFWSFMRRTATGTYQCISRKHLGRYCDEFMFRHNYRHLKLGELFDLFFTMPMKKLTSKELHSRPTWKGVNKSAAYRERRAKGEIKVYKKRKKNQITVEQPSQYLGLKGYEQRPRSRRSPYNSLPFLNNDTNN